MPTEDHSGEHTSEPTGTPRRKPRGRTAMGSAFQVMDEVFNPGAARAREELAAQHEHVIPVPSPGDKMLREGHITIRRPKQ